MNRLVLARQLVAAVPHQRVRETIDQAQSDREDRRELRRPKGRGRHRLSCPACHRFVANINAKCGCGWDPVSGWGA